MRSKRGHTDGALHEAISQTAFETMREEDRNKQKITFSYLVLYEVIPRLPSTATGQHRSKPSLSYYPGK